MNLVIDAGNTEIVLGLAEEGARELTAHWRMSTLTPRTVDEYRHLIVSFMESDGFEVRRVRGAVVGSVVPSVTEALVEGVREITDGSVAVVDGPEGLPIELAVEEPKTVGADRIANTLALREIYARDGIVVDLGTATTYDCVSERGVFLGGVIAPGIMAGLEWLAGRTAKLPRVALEPPPTVIGRRTEQCIQSGIFYSVIDGIDGMVARIKEEWGREETLVIATGGYAAIVGRHARSVEEVDPLLTLRGLVIAGEHLLR